MTQTRATIVGRVYCFAKDQKGLHLKSLFLNYKLINHFISFIRSSISKDDHLIHRVGLSKELYPTNHSHSPVKMGCTSYGCTQSVKLLFMKPTFQGTVGDHRTAVVHHTIRYTA
jgi:hypothetical protein